MPSQLQTFEIASAFGAIDSDAFADERALHAGIVRDVARNANRLRSIGCPMTALDWNVLDGLGDAGVFGGHATWPEWSRLFHIPAPHQPQFRRARVDLTAIVTVDQTVYLQIGTTARPFDPTADLTRSPQIFSVTGTGTWEDYTLTGLPLGTGTLEAFEVGLLGAPVASPASDVGTNAGTVSHVDRWMMYDDAAIFGQNLLFPAARYWVRFTDPDGAQIGDIRRVLGLGMTISVPTYSATPSYGEAVATVTGATASGPSTTLLIYPPFEADETTLYRRATYEIWDSTFWRFGSFAITETS